MLGGAWNKKSHRGRRKEAMKRSLKSNVMSNKINSLKFNKKRLDLLYISREKKKEKRKIKEL